MTINFPKFPHDRRDKDPSPNLNLSAIPLETVIPEASDAQAHTRSHQEMLQQTEYLDEVQVAELKAQLKATPSKTQKKLPLVPISLGLLLLVGGGAMGMYQEYNRPAPPSATQATPIATPVAPTSPPTSAVAVTTTVTTSNGATSSGAVTPTPAPVTTSTSIMNANTPRANPPAPATADNKIIAVPISAPAQTVPHSNNTTNSANSPVSNPANNPPAVDITNNLPANAPSADTTSPVNNSNPTQAQPTTPTSEDTANNASQSLKKSQASYDEFVKRSESTIYVDHAPIKK